MLSQFEEVLARVCGKDRDKDGAKDWSKDVEAAHGKVCVAIEEMVNQGLVEHLDADAVLRLSKLKKPPSGQS